MFNYGNANEAQKEAISATDGLVLITAGPGTGKTFTLVKRAVYLIQECGIKPEQIMMATFTEKAAKELITRITNELAERNISVNVNEMYIGTFHSLCLRIIKENLEFTRLKRNYRLLDTFDQKYLVFRNFHKFKNIEGIDELLSKGGSWKRSDEICTYINHLSEEMVDIEALQSDDNPGIRTLGRVMSVYQEMLEEGNLIDFSTIQTECYKLLMQNKQILEELQDKLQYLMIDEYQDTNYIQEGMEFPIVLVDSLSNVPRKTYKELMTEVEEKYFHRPAFEPYDQTKYFDFWRLYYTAFSRAQNLLVLTCDENKRTPSQYFRDIYDEIQSVDSDEFDLSEFSFQSVKKVNLKNSFSFTSHITVYETCALQYKFYKELEFMPVRQNAMMFGTLVHETIEDIHRAAIRGEVDKITNDNIATWFESNYNSLVKSEHTYLAEPQRNAALSQVERYAERMDGKWASVQQAEVDVSLVKEDYIIDGKIDLVKGVDGTVEIVDFKSERKPDMVKMRERLEHYRRQLQIYAYLIEQRTGQKVSKMHLYYTGEENGNPMITYPYTRTAIEGTVAAFDDTVHKILRKDFKHRCDDAKTCKNCDFRYYCNK